MSHAPCHSATLPAGSLANREYPAGPFRHRNGIGTGLPQTADRDNDCSEPEVAPPAGSIARSVAPRLQHIALPVEPHHLALGTVAIPLLGRINVGETA